MTPNINFHHLEQNSAILKGADLPPPHKSKIYTDWSKMTNFLELTKLPAWTIYQNCSPANRQSTPANRQSTPANRQSTPANRQSTLIDLFGGYVWIKENF